jgi:regulator of sigma E protease
VPLPALDGGRLLFVLIEGIRRKPINQRFAQMANQFGFIALLLLMAIITYKDILKLFN